MDSTSRLENPEEHERTMPEERPLLEQAQCNGGNTSQLIETDMTLNVNTKTREALDDSTTQTKDGKRTNKEKKKLTFTNFEMTSFPNGNSSQHTVPRSKHALPKKFQLRLLIALIITFAVIILSILVALLLTVLLRQNKSSTEQNLTELPENTSKDYDYYYAEDYDDSYKTKKPAAHQYYPPDEIFSNPGPVYRINPVHFFDSDRDGVGDINGIRLHLPYFAYFKVRTLLLFPLLKSHDTFGNEILDFYSIDPQIGNIAHFVQLAKEAKKYKIDIAFAFNPNQVSIYNNWFVTSNQSQYDSFQFGGQEPSSADSATTYNDYFIWRNCIDDFPNNWINFFGRPVWHRQTIDSDRCYYSQRGASTAEINYSNNEMKGKLKNMLSYWANNGVKKFFFNDAEYLIETNLDQNEQAVLPSLPSYNSIPCNARPTYCRIDHSYSRDTSENIRFLTDIREYLVQYGAQLVIRLDHMDFKNSQSCKRYLERYINSTNQAADYVMLSPFTGIYTQITKYDVSVGMVSEASSAESRAILWESTDVSRNIVRLQSRLQYPADIQLMALPYLLPGSPVLFYGDELGLEGELYQKMPHYVKKQLSKFKSMIEGTTTIDQQQALHNKTSPSQSSQQLLFPPIYPKMIESLQFIRENYLYKQNGQTFHSLQNMVLQIAIELISSNFMAVAINFGYTKEKLDFEVSFAGKSWHVEHIVWSTAKPTVEDSNESSSYIRNLQIGEIKLVLLSMQSTI